MPNQYPQPFFLNGTSLSDSTSIYTNSALTIFAVNGWYSDGTVIRQLIDGVLQPVQPCPACGVPCGGGLILVSSVSGAYKLSINTGGLPANVGAIVIRFSPQSVPEGIQAVFQGVTYNKVSSQNFGYLSAPINQPTFLGITGSEVSACPAGSLVGGPYSLTDYLWDGTAFVATGGTSSISVTAPQDQTTPTNPGECVMVIPKISYASPVVDITCYSVCVDAIFSISIECPAVLKKFKASVGVETLEDPVAFCELPLNDSYYFVSVNGVAPYLGLYDWIFTDQYGQAILADGYYKTSNLTGTNDTIRVQNGVITEILDTCS